MCAAAADGGRPPLPPNDGSGKKFELPEESIPILIFQIQSLLDMQDGKLRECINHCKALYGVHFPELGKLVRNNTLYIKIVRRIGLRHNLLCNDVSDLLTGSRRAEVLRAALLSRGVEFTKENLVDVNIECNKIAYLWKKLKMLKQLLDIYMPKVAPNLTRLMGSELAAKIIVLAANLMCQDDVPAPPEGENPAGTTEDESAEQLATSAKKILAELKRWKADRRRHSSPVRLPRVAPRRVRRQRSKAKTAMTRTVTKPAY